MTEKKMVKFYDSEYSKPYPKYVDGLDMYKYLHNIFNSSKDEKDEIILVLMEEICKMSHFIAEKHPDYPEFLGKVKNKETKNDDLLKFDLMTDEEIAAGITESFDVENIPSERIIEDDTRW